MRPSEKSRDSLHVSMVIKTKVLGVDPFSMIFCHLQNPAGRVPWASGGFLERSESLG